MAKLKAKRRPKKRRSLAEKVWIVISIFLAIAMVLTTVASLFM